MKIKEITNHDYEMGLLNEE